MRRQMAAIPILAIFFLAGASCQDNGEKAAKLKPLVNGTLPNAKTFQAAAASIDTAAYLGVLSPWPVNQPAPKTVPPTGIMMLGLGLTTTCDGYLFVPNTYNPAKANNMILALHGAGKSGLDALGVLIDQANSSGIMLLAPDSRGATWDALPSQGGYFGPDVAFISAAMAEVFALYNVNTSTLGIQGFSDGATYALGLGMTNGNIFSKVMANSPGGVIAQRVQGRPAIFMSAGFQDTICPINQAGNPTACYLKSLGYNVTYFQFQGKHEVPKYIADAMVQWYLGTYSQAGTFPSGICSA